MASFEKSFKLLRKKRISFHVASNVIEHVGPAKHNWLADGFPNTHKSLKLSTVMRGL